MRIDEIAVARLEAEMRRLSRGHDGSEEGRVEGNL